jgi:hypothetical protein
MRSLWFSALLLVACSDSTPHVGNYCYIDLTGVLLVQSVASIPAEDCEGDICLKASGDDRSMCSADCESDADCIAHESSTCFGQFVCDTPFDVGDLAGRQMCVCVASSSSP